MADLSYSDKEIIESALQMESGYVSDFSNRTFKDFMYDTAKIDIYSDKYASKGDSKAKRLNSFLELEPNLVVGHVLKELLEREKNKCTTDKQYCSCKLGIKIAEKLMSLNESDFLNKAVDNLDLTLLKLDSNITQLLENRIEEIRICMKNGSYLAATILIGSTLEGVFFNLAKKDIENFNRCSASPKDSSGKVLVINKWSLSNFIDVAFELKYIGSDIKQFSHTLRDFRNYIHPYHQLKCNFTPNEDTVKMCWQAFQATIKNIINHIKKVKSNA